MEEKNNIFETIAKFGKVIYLVYLLVALFVLMFIPNVGANAFKLYLVKAVTLTVLGIIPFAAIIISYLGEKKLEGKMIIVFLIAGILFLFMGVVSLFNYSRDNGTQPLRKHLVQCSVSRKHTVSTKGGTTSYSLQGWYNMELYEFSLRGVSKKERERMTRSKGEFDVVYYPNTGVLLSYSFVEDPTKPVAYHTSTKADYYNYNAEQAKGMVENNTSVSSANNKDILNDVIDNSNLPDNADYSERIYIKDAGYNIYGFEVGDSYVELNDLLAFEKKFELDWLAGAGDEDPAPAETTLVCYKNGNVRISCIFDGDKVIKELRLDVD